MNEKRFSWIKDCLIQIVFICVAVIFTVMVAHMSIREQYSDYYRQHMEYRDYNLAQNIDLLFEGRGVTDYTDRSILLSIIFPEDEADRYEAFADFRREMDEQLYSSLSRGVIVMVLGYIIFSVIVNIKKKKTVGASESEESPAVAAKTNAPHKLKIQFLSMAGCALVAFPLLLLQGNFYGVLQTVMIAIGGLFLGLFVAHIVRLVMWVIAKRSGRADSGYSSQTTQFCMFLLIFLSMFSLSMHNGFSAHVEADRLEEMRLNSVFASLASDTEFNFGEETESFIAFPVNGGFEVMGGANFSHAQDLFHSAWMAQSSLMGIRGDYKYGVTVVFDAAVNEVTSLSIVRQPTELLAQELWSATLDFLLAMSATVFAIIFLFAEVNKLLETINVPNMKRERAYRYAGGAKSLNFLVTVCQTIPAYFFVLIVLNFYEHNPISWLPGEIAVVLPLTVVLLMMVSGGDIVRRFVKVASRKLMLVGCMIGAAGFVAMGMVDDFFMWLLLLTIAYMGVSIVYTGLQNFISEMVDTGYEEFKTLGAETLSGEYLGGTSGAVIGAIIYVQFGLFAAFVFSAAILVLVAIFIRFILPVREKAEETTNEKNDFGFLKFLMSKRVLLFLGFVMTPFIVGGFFIKQFAPLYADSIGLSPGAASWTFLLMTLAAAFAAPATTRFLEGRFSKVSICILANFISAAGLILFSLMPGIATMYIASALLGMAIGTGTSMVEGGFSELEESRQYRGSVFVFKLFGALLGQLGVFVFSFAHALSPQGEYVLYIAAVIAVPTLIYMFISRRKAHES